MSLRNFPSLFNGKSIELKSIPVLSTDVFREKLIQATAARLRLVAFFGSRRDESTVRLYAVAADDQHGSMVPIATDVQGQYPALTPDCPQAHLFEREIHEQYGLKPVGHPWLKPVRFPLAEPGGTERAGTKPEAAVGLMDFFRMGHDEVHEVAVGPVHAGVIEPGHFRFQCHGENVYHLETSFGYQHRGLENSLTGGPDKRTLCRMETVAGDTTIGHGLAYCLLIEALSGVCVPARAQAIRGIALELERLANHIGDLGALAGDVGFLPTAAYCGAIRGDFLNMQALISGSRLGRSLLRPGGVAFDLEPDRRDELKRRIEKGRQDVSLTVELLWDAPSVLARFETTGILTRQQATDMGMVGPAARACGLNRDVRQDYPTGIYRLHQLLVSTVTSGDVYGRAYIRWMEIQRSIEFILELLEALPVGEISRTVNGGLAPDRFVTVMTEGWRGEICHVGITDGHGRFRRYKIIDPSFHNWFGLALAMRGQAIFDFPLCNKSFNLSYCGFDL